jgi:hypothetical protein
MKAAAFSIALAALASSAIAQEAIHAPPAAAPAPPAAPTVRDQPIYIYSFLDLREIEFTRKVLDALDSGLKDRLHAVNADATILEYRQTPQGEFLSDSLSVGQSSTAVPVRAVIAANATQEAATGAKLRMVIFPSRYDVAGAWRFYDIRWLIYAVGSNKPVLDYTYHGKHLVMLKNSENATGRANKLLDAVFDEMKAKGLI